MTVEWRNVASDDVPYLDSLDCWVALTEGDEIASVWLENAPMGGLEWEAWMPGKTAMSGRLGSVE